MPSYHRFASLLFVLCLLSACGGTRNLQSVKSPEYSQTPHSILIIQESGVPLDSAFKEEFTKSLKSCGITLQFMQPITGMMNASKWDAVLRIRALSSETTTQLGAGGGSWVSKTLYEFSLSDVASQKQVWISRADFVAPVHDQLRLGDALSAGPRGWADDIVNQMKKDDLLGGCSP